MDCSFAKPRREKSTLHLAASAFFAVALSIAQPVWAQDTGDDSGGYSESFGNDDGDGLDAGTMSDAGGTFGVEGGVGTDLDAVDRSVGVIEAPEGASGFSASTAADNALPPEFNSNQLLPEGLSPQAGAQNDKMMAFAPGPVTHPPIVVELFTSQGCSSCPTADEMLGDLASRADVLALSWHVDYWDYLGWADAFAKPEFTERQQGYAAIAGERSVYTPQLLVGGTDTLISQRPADLIALIENQMARPVAVSVSSTLTDKGFQIELTPRVKSKRGVAILLVRYAPSRTVDIKAGENHGMKMTYRNVVLSVEQIATWDGASPLRLTVTPAAQASGSFPDDTRHAILAQQIGKRNLVAGPILTAVKLD